MFKHTWADGRVDRLPAYYLNIESPGDVVRGPLIGSASMYSITGTIGTGGGAIGVGLHRLDVDLFADIPWDDTDDTCLDAAQSATIVRGALLDVVDQWVRTSSPTSEFFPGLCWIDVALAGVYDLGELAAAAEDESCLPACMFPDVALEEATADWYLSLTLALRKRELEQLRRRWTAERPWAHRVFSAEQPLRREFERRATWVAAQHGW